MRVIVGAASVRFSNTKGDHSRGGAGAEATMVI